MIKNDDKIEKLLKKPYYVVDILPLQVPKKNAFQYFEVEKYYLKHKNELCNKFFDILLKLNCYYNFIVILDDKEFINPLPDKLLTLMKNKKYMSILVNNTLITYSKDDSYMTIYNVNKKMLNILKCLVKANGLFIWK